MSGGIGGQSKEFGIKQVWLRMCDFDELHNHFETNPNGVNTKWEL